MAGKTAHHNSFQSRLAKARRDFPDASDAELIVRVKASYRARTKEGKARQKAALVPQARTRDRRAGRKPESIQKSAKAGRSLDGIDVITFVRDLVHVELWPAQTVALKALYGLKLDAKEMKLYAAMTGGLTAQHGVGVEAIEAVLCLGARSGKSLLTSICALYETLVKGNHWRKNLRKGETGYAVLVGTRLQQAVDICQGTCARLILDSAELRGHLADEPTQQRIMFRNGLAIMSLPANSTAGRGLPIYFLALDESAHYFTEGPKADEAIFASLSPRLAQFRGGKILLPSTPASKAGLFYSWFSEGFSVEGRCTLQAGTTLINPTINKDYLRRMEQRDVDNYQREFLAQFAEAMSAYFHTEHIDRALVLTGDVPPIESAAYFCGIDQSGLSGRDRFGAAVAHVEDDGTVQVDAVRSWSTTDIDVIMGELSTLARAYRIASVQRDAYSAGWIASALSKHGLESELRPAMARIYANTKALMIANRLRCPDNPELRTGLQNTTAYFSRNNSLSIGHERTAAGHGDLADAVVSAIWAASGRSATDLAFSEDDIDAAFAGKVEGFYRAA